jgi:hypothetical protein
MSVAVGRFVCFIIMVSDFSHVTLFFASFSFVCTVCTSESVKHPCILHYLFTTFHSMELSRLTQKFLSDQRLRNCLPLGMGLAA